MSSEVDVLDRLKLLPDDVVECVEDYGNGNYTVGKRYTVTEYGCVVNDRGGTLHGVKSKFRVVIRANPPAGPVRTVMRKEIVPGSYGHVWVESAEPEIDNVILGFRNNAFKRLPSVGFSAAELRVAIVTLTEIADALEAPTQ